MTALIPGSEKASHVIPLHPPVVFGLTQRNLQQLSAIPSEAIERDSRGYQQTLIDDGIPNEHTRVLHVAFGNASISTAPRLIKTLPNMSGCEFVVWKR